MVCGRKKQGLTNVMIRIKRVTEFAELEGIKKLQRENLKSSLSVAESEAEGFVTAQYTMDFLMKMHEAGPSIIAKDDDQVIGYALVAVPSIRHHHELLADLFNTIDHTDYQGILLKEAKYVVVGQLCVSKKYRGIGLVQQMYQYYRESLQEEFEYCITDIAQDNPRSLKAHIKSGFRDINSLDYGGLKWDIVLWDWRS
jgi:ribosomal protein S18 acetylase RimI-like enzyme